MTILHAFILGIVEGVTEFLPISSTGHLILASKLLGIESSEFLKTFTVAIQLGGILAVATVYGKTLLHNKGLWSRLAVAFAPTAVVGLTLYPWIRSSLDNSRLVLWTLLLGGILLIAFERWYKEPADTQEDLSRMPLGHALLIGLAQSLAVIPGVSRAAATICGGLALGLSRRAVVEFSFLLALPTMAAATSLDIFKNFQNLQDVSLAPLAVGFITSWIMALVALKWLLSFIRTHNFTIFGIYRIVVALALWTIL